MDGSENHEFDVFESFEKQEEQDSKGGILTKDVQGSGNSGFSSLIPSFADINAIVFRVRVQHGQSDIAESVDGHDART